MRAKSHYDAERTKTEDYINGNIGFGFVCLLLFIAGILINLVNIFPVLKPLRPQYTFAILALIGLIFGLFTKAYRLNWTGIQTSYTIFMIATFLSLMNLQKYGLFASGWNRFCDSSKTFFMLVLLGSYAAHPRMFKVCFSFFLLAVGIFQIHCLKAIFAGVALVHGRFDSWIGQISNSDFIGTFFAVMVPIHLELFLIQKRFVMRSIFLGGVMANLFIMVKTQTRAAFLVLMVILFLWTFMGKNVTRRLKMCVLVAMALLTFGSITDIDSDYRGGFFSRMQSILSEQSRAEDSNIQLRYLLWQEGLRIWSKSPFWGCGITGMDLEISDAVRMALPEGFKLSQYSLHQSFIQVLAERGAIAGISYCMFLFLILFYLRQVIRLSNENELSEYYSAVARGLRLGVIGLVVGSFFMSLEENWILIFFAGFTAGLYGSVRLTKEQTLNRRDLVLAR